MEVTINSQEKSASMSRNVVDVTVTFGTESTPSRAAVKDSVAKKLKADATMVIIRGFETKFGTSSAKITAIVYDSVEAMNKFETVPMANRSHPKPKTEAPA